MILELTDAELQVLDYLVVEAGFSGEPLKDIMDTPYGRDNPEWVPDEDLVNVLAKITRLMVCNARQESKV